MTALYGGLFLVAGALLLTVTYVLVASHIEALERQRDQVAANLETARYATELLAGFSYRTDATQQQAAMQALFWQQMQTGTTATSNRLGR